MKNRKKQLWTKELVLENGVVIEEKRSKTPLIVLLVLLTVLISVKVTGFNLQVLVERGNEFFVILRQMVPPNVTYMKQVWSPLFDTIKMSLLGSFAGAFVAIPFAVAAAGNIVKSRVIVTGVRVFLSVVRTFPTLVMALIATYMFGLGTLAGTTAIAVFTFAYVGKQLYEQIETIDMGSYEAAQAMGAGRAASFVTAIAPQVMPTYMATCLFCFEGNVRYASILGYVGAGGLGIILNEKIGWREYSNVGMILAALFVTVVLIEWISHYLRRKLT